MEIWERNQTKDILKSLETELAKAQNELNCAKGDALKASNRVAFCLSAIHELKKRDIKE
jgi:hypothetical protein